MGGCSLIDVSGVCMYAVASILHFYKSNFNNAVCNVCTHACMYGLCR